MFGTFDSEIYEIQAEVVTIGFWRWYITFRDIGFSDFIHRPGIKKQTKEKHDVSETGSVSILRWRKIPILLGPLERSSLNHVQWPNISDKQKYVFISWDMVAILVNI
jgi:hypothetical protein